MCGDHSTYLAIMARKAGSPPHVRGPPPSLSDNQNSSGITPACAGTTLTLPRVYPMHWDHPRMCGDHQEQIDGSITTWGSPPHVRGPRKKGDEVYQERGITPACAGTTVDTIALSVILRDHPRMCGDHL